jgi:hypothetical protein
VRLQVDVGALAGVGELGHDVGVEAERLFPRALTLRIDRQAIVAVVGFHLAVRRHAQVGEGALGGLDHRRFTGWFVDCG